MSDAAILEGGDAGGRRSAACLAAVCAECPGNPTDTRMVGGTAVIFERVRCSCHCHHVAQRL